MAQATVQSAEVARRGILRAAKFSLAAAVLAALIAGLCGVVGVVVQGHFALEQARIAATAGTNATEKATTLPTAEPSPQAQGVKGTRLAATLEPFIDAAKLSAICFCVSALVPGMAISIAQQIIPALRR
jgi:hypothetical protein